MTPTPETDAQCYDCTYRGDMGSTFTADRGKHDPYGDHVDADFARKLERERDEARQKLAILQDLLNDLEDPLQLIAEYWDKDETLESMTGACWHAVGTAEKALEKIRPYLNYYGS